MHHGLKTIVNPRVQIDPLIQWDLYLCWLNNSCFFREWIPVYLTMGFPLKSTVYEHKQRAHLNQGAAYGLELWGGKVSLHSFPIKHCFCIHCIDCLCLNQSDTTRWKRPSYCSSDLGKTLWNQFARELVGSELSSHRRNLLKSHTDVTTQWTSAE